jgi:hypothetical protein
MLKSTKEKLLKEVEKIIENRFIIVYKVINEKFETFGFKVEFDYPYNYKITKSHDELERKYNLLLKHLGSEYFKKEIKETNGHEKSYVKEGFRKIKK